MRLYFFLFEYEVSYLGEEHSRNSHILPLCEIIGWSFETCPSFVKHLHFKRASQHPTFCWSKFGKVIFYVVLLTAALIHFQLHLKFILQKLITALYY